jgi:hypothetical protein
MLDGLSNLIEQRYHAVDLWTRRPPAQRLSELSTDCDADGTGATGEARDSLYSTVRRRLALAKDVPARESVLICLRGLRDARNPPGRGSDHTSASGSTAGSTAGGPGSLNCSESG